MIIDFNPGNEQCLHLIETLDGGIDIYGVDDTMDGMMAVRRAVDASLGRDSNPWCLISRKHGISDAVLEMFTPDQAKTYGLDESDENLDAAWEFWCIYSAYPKKVAFKENHIFAFSANSDNELLWHDLKNNSHKRLLDCIL